MEAQVKSSSPITTWLKLRAKYEEYVTKAESSRWIFRGQQDTSWHLQPSLQRAMEHFHISLSEMRRYESRLLREFKRHFHSILKFFQVTCALHPSWPLPEWHEVSL
jgi:hypothetical protein